MHAPEPPPASLETHREPTPSQSPDVVDTQSLANQIMHDTADFTEFNRQQATKNLLGFHGNKQQSDGKWLNYLMLRLSHSSRNITESFSE